MSTRIYQAWRFSVRYWNKFIRLAAQQLLSAVAVEVSNHLPNIAPPVTKDMCYQMFKDLMRMAVMDSVKAERSIPPDMLDLTCGFGFVIGEDGWVYAVPYGEERLRTHLKFPRWAHEYAYYNSSDEQLKRMSYEKWQKRREDWEKVDFCMSVDHKGAPHTRLTYHVIDLRPPFAEIYIQRIYTKIFGES